MAAYRTRRQGVPVEAWQWGTDDVPPDVLTGNLHYDGDNGHRFMVNSELVPLGQGDWIVQSPTGNLVVVPQAQFDGRFVLESLSFWPPRSDD